MKRIRYIRLPSYAVVKKIRRRVSVRVTRQRFHTIRFSNNFHDLVSSEPYFISAVTMPGHS